MNETAYKSPMELYAEEEWAKLSASERALCVNYRKQLLGNVGPRKELIIKINEIHAKYPDFHVGCIPCSLSEGA